MLKWMMFIQIIKWTNERKSGRMNEQTKEFKKINRRKKETNKQKKHKKERKKQREKE
jgi:hypothetical protein